MSGTLVLWVRATTPPYRERQLHINDVKPYIVSEEIQFPPVEEEWSPDYIDPFLDDEAEPGQPRGDQAAAIDLWWDDGGTRELDEDVGTEWLWEMEGALEERITQRNPQQPAMAPTTWIEDDPEVRV